MKITYLDVALSFIISISYTIANNHSTLRVSSYENLRGRAFDRGLVDHVFCDHAAWQGEAEISGNGGLVDYRGCGPSFVPARCERWAYSDAVSMTEC
jgi:hypothetical protein